MKYKTLFRLMLKFVGLYLCVTGVLAIVGSLAGSALSLQLYGSSIRTQRAFRWANLLLPLITPALKAGCGVYLFRGGEWIVNLAIPSNHPYCPECGYDLRGNISKRCPECGTAIDMEKLAPPSSDEQPPSP